MPTDTADPDGLLPNEVTGLSPHEAAQASAIFHLVRESLLSGNTQSAPTGAGPNPSVLRKRNGRVVRAALRGLTRAGLLASVPKASQAVGTPSRPRGHTTTRGKKYTAFGETKSLADWSDDPRARVTRDVLYNRITTGWDVEMAIETPLLKSVPALDPE
ncbi:hypothetical protein [Streptomyces sp. NPDC101455]|uniref:hypothetical protein n=1 Tax=Streptomyces sp. NPDC101455 TaxID=3366142 RepID=UPI00382F7536